MCSFCEDPVEYIAESIEMDEEGWCYSASVSTSDAYLTIERFSGEDPFAGSDIVISGPINYCPMCGKPMFDRRRIR